jgi:hypothetical protein
VAQGRIVAGPDIDVNGSSVRMCPGRHSTEEPNAKITSVAIQRLETRLINCFDPPV